jgi:hypothetical protein
MNRYPNWVKVAGRPFKRRFWILASRLTSKRRINGVSIRVSGNVADIFKPFIDNHYEIEEWEALWKFGQNGQTFLDIGANAGVLTTAMSMIAGLHGHVIAFEPNPYTYYELINTLKLNQCSNVIPIQALVLDKVDIHPFYIISLLVRVLPYLRSQ